MTTTVRPLDDFPAGDIAAAAFALRTLGPRMVHRCLRVRAYSRIARGLWVLHQAGTIAVQIWTKDGQSLFDDHLFLNIVRRRG